MKKLDVIINGIKVDVTEGSRVLDGIEEAGFTVPTLCYDKRLAPQGTCRMCLVEVEVNGKKENVASCTAFSQDEMRVETHTDFLKGYRKTLLELLLSETSSPKSFAHDDPTTRSEFFRAVKEYEAKQDAFPTLETRKPASDNNPFIQRDYDLCIACYRCTNICNDWEQAGAITVDGRGQESKIFSFFNNELMASPCTFCGQCINTCPTGALSDRKVEMNVDLAPIDRTRTICPYCGVGCGINLLTQQGKVVGSEPDFTAPSQGSLCVKGQFGSWEFVSSEERLKYPLIKENDVFKKASWGEALDLIVEKFEGNRDVYGPDSMVCWASARVVTEANYLMQKFTRCVIGTNNIDNCSRT